MTNPDPLPGDEDLEDVMSELKATPGPWKIFENFKHQHLIGPEDPRYGVVATAHKNSGGDEPETVQANAHLISAAPELYEALTEVMSWIDGWEPQFVEDDGWADTEEKVEAAVKKAGGEQ